MREFRRHTLMAASLLCGRSSPRLTQSAHANALHCLALKSCIMLPLPFTARLSAPESLSPPCENPFYFWFWYHQAKF
eukprot:1433910-Rhodomonas_salina.3